MNGSTKAAFALVVCETEFFVRRVGHAFESRRLRRAFRRLEHWIVPPAPRRAQSPAVAWRWHVLLSILAAVGALAVEPGTAAAQCCGNGFSGFGAGPSCCGSAGCGMPCGMSCGGGCCGSSCGGPPCGMSSCGMSSCGMSPCGMAGGPAGCGGPPPCCRPMRCCGSRCPCGCPGPQFSFGIFPGGNGCPGCGPACGPACGSACSPGCGLACAPGPGSGCGCPVYGSCGGACGCEGPAPLGGVGGAPLQTFETPAVPGAPSGNKAGMPTIDPGDTPPAGPPTPIKPRGGAPPDGAKFERQPQASPESRQPQGSLDSAATLDRTQASAGPTGVVERRFFRQTASAGFRTRVLVADSGRMISRASSVRAPGSLDFREPRALARTD